MALKYKQLWKYLKWDYSEADHIDALPNYLNYLCRHIHVHIPYVEDSQALILGLW